MIDIRPAKFSDHGAIAKLHAENWRQNYRGILRNTFLDNEVEQERFIFWYNRLRYPGNNQEVKVAIKDKNLAGFSCLLLNDDPAFGSLLDNLHVAKSFQRAGIGKLLMREVAKVICDKAANPKMYLWVYQANEAAINVYRRLGGKSFEITEQQNEDGTTVAIMQVCLGRCFPAILIIFHH